MQDNTQVSMPNFTFPTKEANQEIITFLLGLDPTKKF